MMADLSILTPEQELEKLRAENMTKLQALQVEGFVLDPITMLKLRLDVVTAVLLGEDTDLRTELESLYEGKIGEVLDFAREQVNRAKLTAGLGAGAQLSFGDAR